MSALATAYQASAGGADDTKTMDIMMAVYAARGPAREEMETSRYATDFIHAAQDYQASLRNFIGRRDIESVTLSEGYFGAKAAAGRDPSTAVQRRLVKMEMQICDHSEIVRLQRDRMLEAGQAYMKREPLLALQLPLNPAARVWNRLRLALHI